MKHTYYSCVCKCQQCDTLYNKMNARDHEWRVRKGMTKCHNAVHAIRIGNWPNSVWLPINKQWAKIYLGEDKNVLDLSCCPSHISWGFFLFVLFGVFCVFVCPLLPVEVDCQLLICPSVFSDVYKQTPYLVEEILCN